MIQMKKKLPIRLWPNNVVSRAQIVVLMKGLTAQYIVFSERHRNKKSPSVLRGVLLTYKFYESRIVLAFINRANVTEPFTTTSSADALRIYSR